MTREELLAQMEEILETKGEKALEAFVLEHFAELPEDVQGKAMLGFYSEALEKEAGEARITEVQKDGLEAMEALEALRQEAATRAQG